MTVTQVDGRRIAMIEVRKAEETDEGAVAHS